MQDEQVKIVIRHWAYREGQDAAVMGYAGANPYHDALDGVARVMWLQGYIEHMTRRLRAGKAALGDEL